MDEEKSTNREKGGPIYYCYNAQTGHRAKVDGGKGKYERISAIYLVLYIQSTFQVETTIMGASVDRAKIVTAPVTIPVLG